MTTISLPEHLHSALWALLSPSSLLPEDLTSEVLKYVKADQQESATEIPFEVVFNVSRWAQQNESKQVLRERDLNPRDYDRIALLAGTITSPATRLPPDPVKDPYAEALQRARERKAISTMINAIFSVFGVGFAAWWSAGNIGWKPESRALLAIFTATVVALTEGVLFFIWQNKQEGSKKKKRVWKRRSEVDKKVDAEDEAREEHGKDETETDTRLRKRIGQKGSPERVLS
jgi:hypothetical protein